MLGIISVALLLTVLQAVMSETPEHCRGPPPGVEKPADCCKLPIIFKEEDFKECGIDKPSIAKIRGPPDCSKHTCLLKKYNLMKDDENVDKEAVGEFLDKWAETNTDFKDAVAIAKERCLTGELPGPPQLCEPNKVALCTMVTVFEECPTWENSDNCKKLKDHINECKPFFSN